MAPTAAFTYALPSLPASGAGAGVPVGRPLQQCCAPASLSLCSFAASSRCGLGGREHRRWRRQREPAHLPSVGRAGSARRAGRPRPAPAQQRPLRASASPPSRSARAAAEQQLTLQPVGEISGTVTLPGSKSLSNRVLLLSALAEDGTSVRVENLLESDDVRYMLDALRRLGVRVVDTDAGRGDGGGGGGAETTAAATRVVTVHGCGGDFPNRAERTIRLFLGNAGTAMRPLTAALCTPSSGQTFILDGVPRMRERPIRDLVEALVQLGADVRCAHNGCPPVEVRTRVGSRLRGGAASVSGRISSQYLSALLMAAPYAERDVEIRIKDTLVSVPYVLMTTKLMAKFGVHVGMDNAESPRCFRVAAGQRYRAPRGHDAGCSSSSSSTAAASTGTAFVEGDASSASYFLAGAAITGGTMTVIGCGRDSVQGDVRFASVLEQMGARVTWHPNAITVARDAHEPLRGVDVDCGDIPDAAMTLAVAALFARGKTTIRNVYNWRVKETERMKAIVNELRKLGARVEEGEDYCVIEPPPPPPQDGTAARRLPAINDDVVIETYDDHRMAMAFSLAACAGKAVTIRDPACTRKTFPDYFDVLASVSRA